MAWRTPLFNERYIPEPNSGCWLWEGPVDAHGYGSHHSERAHRFSWELHRSEIPAGMCVLHKCDTPTCVNPDHLFLGTLADNNADKVRKGRHTGWGRGHPLLSGTKHPLAKLTDEDVLWIRIDPRNSSAVAKDYGVSRQIVWKIKTRQVWTHL